MKTLGKIINERRKGIKKNGDFLQTMLMNDNHSSKGFLNNDQIQDNILTLIIAGQISQFMEHKIFFMNEGDRVLKLLGW